MNERIKELLKQSRRQASEVQTPGSGAYENLVFEKFAELLIKDTVQKCCQYLTKTGRHYAREQLERQFGVEE